MRMAWSCDYSFSSSKALTMSTKKKINSRKSLETKSNSVQKVSIEKKLTVKQAVAKARKDFGIKLNKTYAKLKNNGTIEKFWGYYLGHEKFTKEYFDAPPTYYAGWRDCLVYIQQLRNKNGLRSTRRASKVGGTGKGKSLDNRQRTKRKK